jgi:hypothetical protein
MISFSLFLSIYFAQTPEEREKGGERKGERERGREKERERERKRVCVM